MSFDGLIRHILTSMTLPLSLLSLSCLIGLLLTNGIIYHLIVIVKKIYGINTVTVKGFCFYTVHGSRFTAFNPNIAEIDAALAFMSLAFISSDIMATALAPALTT